MKAQLVTLQNEKVEALAKLAINQERHQQAMQQLEASVDVHQKDIEGAVAVLQDQLHQQVCAAQSEIPIPVVRLW
jgi:hypothetical protein